MKRDFLTISDFSVDEILQIFKQADVLKKKYFSKESYHPLQGKTLGMLFKKRSTRTRISFETGMFHLGGYALFLSSQDIQMERGETVKDSARVFSQYLDGILIRTHKHEEIEEFAQYASVPVINGLSDKFHPCQILSDLFTITEKRGTLNGCKIAYVGDGNNVAHSLLLGAAKMGISISCACPDGYFPDPAVVDQAKKFLSASDAVIEITKDPYQAVVNADIIYTDVWTSMGQDDEYEQRLSVFRNYQINAALVSQAKDDTLVMHCLPAHRGEEITSEILDGEQSIVFEQAQNRLFVQNAILEMLLK